jgi:hypothetical protein
MSSRARTAVAARSKTTGSCMSWNCWFEAAPSASSPALAFRPDLAIVSAGGNDSLRHSFDTGAVERELDAIVEPLRHTGADVLLLELMDIVASGLVPREHAAALDGRMRRLAALTRRVARRHGAILVAMRGHAASADPGGGQRSSARARLPVPAASARQATAVVGSSARPISTRRTE